MGNPLRDRRPLAELAAKGQVIEIANKISDFDRLTRIVGQDLDTLDADRIPPDWRESTLCGRLQFGFADAQRQVAAVEGEVSVTLDAVCQRCLEAFRMPLSVTLRLLPVVGDGETASAGDYEVWELDDDRICPADIVEEALIMAMPLAAMHESPDDCTEYERAVDDQERTTRPFADLKAQLEENR